MGDFSEGKNHEDKSLSVNDEVTIFLLLTY